MRLRWPILRRWNWPLVLAVLYGLSAWGLAVVLPYQPRVRIDLPWETERGWAPSVSFSGDGKSLISHSKSSLQQHLGVWNLAGGGAAKSVERVAKEICMARIDHSGSNVIVALQEHETRFRYQPALLHWDSTNRKLKPFPVHWEQGHQLNELKFSPDGRTVAFATTNWDSRLDRDGQADEDEVNAAGCVMLWNVETRAIVRAIKGHSWPVAFSPNGRYLAARAVGPRQRIKVFDLETGLESVRLSHPFKRSNGGTTVNGGICASTLIFSDDSLHLVTVGSEHCVGPDRHPTADYPYFTARIWDVQSGRVISERSWDTGYDIRDDNAAATAWFILESDEDGHASIYDPFSGKRHLRFQFRGFPWYKNNNLINMLESNDIHPSPDGCFFVIREWVSPTAPR